MFNPTLLITQSLALTVALDQLRVLLAALFLVVVMFGPPPLLSEWLSNKMLAPECLILFVFHRKKRKKRKKPPTEWFLERRHLMDAGQHEGFATTESWHESAFWIEKMRED